jgi:hypothetical protein
MTASRPFGYLSPPAGRGKGVCGSLRDQHQIHLSNSQRVTPACGGARAAPDPLSLSPRKGNEAPRGAEAACRPQPWSVLRWDPSPGTPGMTGRIRRPARLSVLRCGFIEPGPCFLEGPCPSLISQLLAEGLGALGWSSRVARERGGKARAQGPRLAPRSGYHRTVPLIERGWNISRTD